MEFKIESKTFGALVKHLEDEKVTEIDAWICSFCEKRCDEKYAKELMDMLRDFWPESKININSMADGDELNMDELPLVLWGSEQSALVIPPIKLKITAEGKTFPIVVSYIGSQEDTTYIQ